MSEPPQADQEPTARPRKAGTPASSVLRWSVALVGGLLAALVLIVGVAMVFAIPIDLSVARGRIDEIVVEGLELQLETNVAGEPNWLIGKPGDATDAGADQGDANKEDPIGSGVD